MALRVEAIRQCNLLELWSQCWPEDAVVFTAGELERDMVAAEICTGSIKRLKPTANLSLSGQNYIIYLKGRTLSKAVAEFLQFTRDIRTKKHC